MGSSSAPRSLINLTLREDRKLLAKARGRDAEGTTMAIGGFNTRSSSDAVDIDPGAYAKLGSLFHQGQIVSTRRRIIVQRRSKANSSRSPCEHGAAAVGRHHSTTNDPYSDP